MRYEIILCPRQELNLRPAGLQPAALTKLSYRGFILHAEATPTTWRDAHSSGGGTRTRNHWLMKPALYHLSYTRIHTANSALTRYMTLPVFIFVPSVGLEPTTSTVSEWRSHQVTCSPRPTTMRPGVRASCSKPPTRPVSTSYPRVPHGSTRRSDCSHESRWASRIILIAAFKSLSCQAPQTEHAQLRTLKSFVTSSLCPQFEHI